MVYYGLVPELQEKEENNIIKSILLEVWITAPEEAVKSIAQDLHEILNDNGITNSVKVKEDDE